MRKRALLAGLVLAALWAAPAQAVDCTATPLPEGCPGGSVAPIKADESVAEATNASGYDAAATDPDAGAGVASTDATTTTNLYAPGAGVVEAADRTLCTDSGCPVDPMTGLPILPAGWQDQAPDPLTATRTLLASGDSASLTGTGALAARGCRREWAQRTSRTLLGFVFYRFRVNKAFCWNGQRVSDVREWVEFLDAASTAYYRGIKARASHYYCVANCWSTYLRRWGHYTFRQGQVDNCILRYGCIRTEYPWVKIWARPDGTWSWDTGGT